MSDQYPWIIRHPIPKPPPPPKPTRQRTGECARCGYWWIGTRVMCPACLTPSEGERCAHCRRIVRVAAGECEHGPLCETCRRALEALNEEVRTDAV